MKKTVVSLARRISRLIGLPLGSFLIAGAAPITPAAAQPLSKPVTQALPSGDTREVGYLTLRDGTRLSYVAYYRSSGERRPVILTFTPYGGGGAAEEEARPYLDRGYAFVGVDIRGTNCSSGELSLLDPKLADDGVQVIEMIGIRSWSNRSVGMIGMSYPGHTQIFAAAKRPKYLKAIVPGAVTADIWREAFAPQGLFNTNMAGGWAFDLRHPAAANRRASWGDTECDVTRALQGRFSAVFDEVKEHLLIDDWRNQRRMDSYIDRVNIPTLFVGAWQDHVTASTGVINLYQRLRAPKRLLMQSGGHFVYNDRKIVRDEILRWMDRWLKGKKNGVEQEPVKIFWEVHNQNGTATPNWTTVHSQWPLPQVRNIALFLRQDGTLENLPSSAAQGERTYTSPTATEYTGDNLQFALAPQPMGSLFYRSLPMENDMAIVGLPQLDIFLSSTQPDTDLMVVLHDVDEAGNTTFVQRGIVRASLREIDPAASSPDERVFSLRSHAKLERGEVYRIELSLPPVGHILRKGHRLEVGIMSPPGIGTPVWGFVLVDEGGRNTVHSSAQHPSSIRIPVVEDMASSAEKLACGAIEFQPCRKPVSPAAMAK